MVTICNQVIVQQYFDKNRALAAGIAALGMSIGNMIGAPIQQLLIDHYGWRGSMIMLSGISLHLLVLCSAYRPLSYTRQRNTSSRDRSLEVTECRRVLARILRDISDLSILRYAPYTMCLVGTFFVGAGGIPFNHHVASHAVFYKVDRQSAALLTTIISLGITAGRLASSFFANMKCSNRVLFYGIAATISGVLIMLYSLAVTYPLMIAIGTCEGFAAGEKVQLIIYQLV